MADKNRISELVNENADQIRKLASDIWDYAELSFFEEKSAAAIKDILFAEGFDIESGIAGIPTAFKASFSIGRGKPVIGILAEYDALDGLSQKAASTQQECREGCHTGHGCGHNLLGAGCVSAAIALKKYIAENNMSATVVLFGCPAEEGAGSKQFIARAGYFDDVDFAYTWHPGTLNTVSGLGNVAIMGANFTFDGIASHAGAAPEMGRSALDAVELMNVGCNYLREHIIDQARVHYAYSDAGGTQPNVVPCHASIKYEVRAPKVSQVQSLFARVVKVAKGAAEMTETNMTYEVTMAFSDYVPNKTLANVMAQALEEYGAPQWSDADYAFAAKFLPTFSKQTISRIREELSEEFPGTDPDKLLERPLHSSVIPFNPKETAYISGSTDVGDAGYATPTVMLNIATSSLGTPGHSWQNTSFACSETGFKGMLRASEVMVLASVMTLEQPQLIEQARAELLKKNGGRYSCPLSPQVQPPIGKY